MSVPSYWALRTRGRHTTYLQQTALPNGFAWEPMPPGVYVNTLTQERMQLMAMIPSFHMEVDVDNQADGTVNAGFTLQYRKLDDPAETLAIFKELLTVITDLGQATLLKNQGHQGETPSVRAMVATG